jgi:cAMP phosphodiesterase
MDHIADLPFLIDAFFSTRVETLNVYGLPETVGALNDHIFNGEIWPSFGAISLSSSDKPAMKTNEIKANVRYEVESVALTPFETNHTVKSVGYVIEKANKKLCLSPTRADARIYGIY